MADEHDQATLLELGRLSAKLLSNAKTRRSFQKAVKEVEPDRRFPEMEIEDLRAELEEKRAQDEIARQQRETEQRLAAQKAALGSRYSAAQIAEIEGVMTKYGISDYEAGAKIYGADQGPATPAPSPGFRHGSRWELPKNDDLLKDPAKWANDMANSVIDELKAGKAF